MSKPWSLKTFSPNPINILMSQREDKKENSMFLALLLFLGAGGLVFAYLGEEKKVEKPGTSIQSSIQSEKYEKTVNRHLMHTNENVELQRQRMQVENAQVMMRGLSASQAQEAYQNDYKLNMDSDTRSKDLANELGRGERAAQAYSPHDVLQAEMYNAEIEAEQAQAYREEYARQFIENARRGGYQVRLSDDLSRVISVKPISGEYKGVELQGSSRQHERIQ